MKHRMPVMLEFWGVIMKCHHYSQLSGYWGRQGSVVKEKCKYYTEHTETEKVSAVCLIFKMSWAFLFAWAGNPGPERGKRRRAVCLVSLPLPAGPCHFPPGVRAPPRGRKHQSFRAWPHQVCHQRSLIHTFCSSKFSKSTDPEKDSKWPTGS